MRDLEEMTLVAVGVGIGLLVAFAVSRAVVSLLYRISPATRRPSSR